MVSNKAESRNINTVVDRNAQTEYDVPAPPISNHALTCSAVADIKLIN
jgi:hypothetical protein